MVKISWDVWLWLAAILGFALLLALGFELDEAGVAGRIF